MPLDGMLSSSDGPTETRRVTFSEDVLLANLAMDFSAAVAQAVVMTASVPVVGVAKVAEAVVTPEVTDALEILDEEASAASKPVAMMTPSHAIEPDMAFASTRLSLIEVPSNHEEFERYIDALEARLAEHAARAEPRNGPLNVSATSDEPNEPERSEAPTPAAAGACAFSEEDLSLEIPEELDSVQLGAFLDALTQTMLGLPGAIDVFCRAPHHDDARVKPLALLDQLAQQAHDAGIRGIHTFASHCRNLVEALAGSGLASAHSSFAALRRGVTVLKQMGDVVWGSGALEVDVAEVLDELIEAEFRALVDVTDREQTQTVSLHIIAEPSQPGRRRDEASDERSLLDRLLSNAAPDRFSRA